ncbi:hypothetical protein GOBAR_DD11295 [Gossypium barbadense]|nr:hypothetical protein GOBAR_DD11295 [Gossypium barbadense]
MKNTLLLRHFVSLLIVGFCCLSSVPVLAQNGPLTDHVKLISGGVNLGAWNNEISELPQAPAPTTYESPSTLVLAAQRTNRPDLLRHFKHYHGGWNITNRHYWASVGFTGAVGFIFAALWIGCILLSVGQDEFHGEVLHTLKYVVNQSDYTLQILNNVTQYLSLAKTINVAELFLPSNVITDTDKLNLDLNAAADTLTENTDENAIVKLSSGVSARGRRRLALISVAAVMLILALLGLLLSVLGHQHAIHIVISDTCLAMEEWVENSHAETVLSNILPCVDQRTTNHTLTQSKQVINSLVKVVNTYIYTFANSNPSPDDNRYYNQSGPSMPPLCSPFDSQLQDHQFGSNEVSMANASLLFYLQALALAKYLRPMHNWKEVRRYMIPKEPFKYMKKLGKEMSIPVLNICPYPTFTLKS